MNTTHANYYHDIVQVGEPRISPDGERVAFVRKVPTGDNEYEATIYIVPVGGGESRQFTVAEGVDSCPWWSPSGDWLRFVSTRGANDDRPQESMGNSPVRGVAPSASRAIRATLLLGRRPPATRHAVGERRSFNHLMLAKR